MAFYSYEGISDDVLDEVHTTSTGETYTLRHSDSLKVEMQYLGKGNSNANSQGWERNSSKYFDSLYQNHPEMFSKKNAERVKNGHAPVVDSKMIAYNPEWAQYKRQPLVHHHIGGDGEAVAVPQNAHKGQGEIHNYEKAAGITDNCKNFSNGCGNQPDSVGKTTSQLHSQHPENPTAESEHLNKEKATHASRESHSCQSTDAHELKKSEQTSSIPRNTTTATVTKQNRSSGLAGKSNESTSRDERKAMFAGKETQSSSSDFSVSQQSNSSSEKKGISR